MPETTETTGTTIQAADLPIVGGDTAPFIFIDGYHAVANVDGVVRMRLFRTRMTSGSQATLEREVVAHLAMSVPTLVSVHNALGELINEMKSRSEIQVVENQGPPKSDA